MVLNVYSVFDVKGCAFSTRFLVLSHNGEALRVFGDAVKDPQTMFNKHPEDYKLYKLAMFDLEKGCFVSLDVPEFLANGSDFLTK